MKLLQDLYHVYSDHYVLNCLLNLLFCPSVLRFVQSVGYAEPAKRASLMRDALGVPPKPRDWPNIWLLPESSRDRRHVGDLQWHHTYEMDKLSESKFSTPWIIRSTFLSRLLRHACYANRVASMPLN